MDPFYVVWFLVWQAIACQANLIDTTVYGEYEYAHYDEGSDYTYFCLASFRCNSWMTGGQLAIPRSASINSELFQLTRGYKAWIGVQDARSEGNWMYVDETPAYYTYWSSGEPNNNKGIEDCAVLNGESSTGGWYDHICDYQHGYTCQFPLYAVRAFDYSEFTFHEEKIDFKSAEARCESVGARLVVIENEKEGELLLQKLFKKYNFLNLAKRTPYWIRDNTDGVSSCMVLGNDGFKKTDCSETYFGVICETARPNMIKVSDEQPTVIESEELQVSCVASGYPLPEVRWYKDDELVSNQVTGTASSTLQITNATGADAGRYACVAMNTINSRKMSSKGVSYVSVLKME